MKKKDLLSLTFATILSTANIAYSAERQVFSSSTTIDNKTYSNITSTEDGGAISAEKSLTVQHSNFSNNSVKVYAPEDSWDYAEYGKGGAIKSYEELEVIDTKFVNNYATGSGGAIYADGDFAKTITNSTFENNSAFSEKEYEDYDYIGREGKVGRGGAIYSTQGSIKIESSTFKANQAAEGGGAIYSQNDITITNSTFSNNKAGVYYPTDAPEREYNGGALYIGDYPESTYIHANIDKSIFDGNSAAWWGGAIYSWNTALKVSDSTFKNNISYSVDKYVYENGHNVEYINGSGGAIYSEGGLLDVDNSIFTNNFAAEDGGAIRISSDYESDKISTIKNSTFTENKTGSSGIHETYEYNENDEEIATTKEITAGYGGAISADGNVRIENSKFINNEAKVVGGAVYYYNWSVGDEINRTLSVEKSTFTGNIAGEKGGAIYSHGDININASIFNNNKSEKDGGAIYNGKDLYWYGGIEEDDDKNVGNLIVTASSFTENKAEENGGAINTNGYTEIETSTFNSNQAKNGGSVYGGHDSGSSTFAELHVDDSNFSNNIATENGGAIYTTSDSGVYSSTFTNNQAKNGGAVYNTNEDKVIIADSTFTENKASENGGAIYSSKNENEGQMFIADSDFKGNSAGNKGGAIYTDSTLNISAEYKDVTFSNNKAAQGNDIYINNTTLNLDANTGRRITLNGGITGNNGSVININGTSVGNITPTGTINLNSAISSDDNSAITVNVYSGTLRPSSEEFLNGTDLYLGENSTLDLMNGKVGVIQTNNFSSDNANLKIDMSLADAENFFDLIDGNSAVGTLNLSQVNITSDLPENESNIAAIDFKECNFFDTISIKTPENGITSLTNDYLYNIKTDDVGATITRLADERDNAIKIDGFALAVSGQDNVKGQEITLSEDRVFSATKDINITNTNLENGWNGNLGGSALTVVGNGHSLNGENNQGISIGENQSLEVRDLNIAGFKTSEQTPGALTVNNGGTLQISAIDNDVTLDKVNTSENSQNNIVYLKGENSKVYLTTSNNKSITVNDAMRSENTSNDITLQGNGTITFNENIDTVTLNNENDNTIHNNYINGVMYNLNSGIVFFNKDEFLNGQNNQLNSINFNGGMLNLANGSVGNVHLDTLTLNSSSSIGVDVDLANKAMDKISANKYDIIGGTLKVSEMNLLSDAKEDITNINFADDNLKNYVETNISTVSYSPIWKYDVGYDKNSGNFTFTRGTNSTNSNNNYTAYNPAILAAPVASQMGGYMGMLDTYQNAFTHLDMQMLKPLKVRQAELQANKYAINDTDDTVYLSNDLNSSGVWAKPFLNYDSVRLKNGPKVSNVSYGTFIGADTPTYDLGGGFSGTFSPYIAYNGSHQSYQGTNIYQNGGTLGFTGTLYKGNFFTGLTAGVGANIAESNTMYGHDEFGLFMAGVASKTGYNFEFSDGKFIFQPSMTLSYTMVDTFNYTNAAGVSIHSDPLHAFQISPQVKFVMNTKNGWQPYLTAGMNWNLLDETKVSANTTVLPEMSVKPYFQYGVGVQKTINDKFTGYLQLVLRNGGRNGIAATGGFRYMLGKDVKNKSRV